MIALPELPRTYNAAFDLLERHVQEGRGERVAIVDDFGEVTYAELAERAGRVASLLPRLGVLPEQRVALCLHDTRDFPAVFLGALKAGVVAVPLNTLLEPDTYASMLEDSRARALFVSDALLARIAPALAKLEHPPQVVIVRAPAGEGVDVDGYEALDALLEGLEPLAQPAKTSPDEVAFWLYSSGSTGAPKGTMHLHSSLIRTAQTYAHGVLGVREDDVVFSAAKLFFAYGLGCALTFPFSVGAKVILMAERPTPEAVARRLTEHGATIFASVPTLFASMLAADVPEPSKVSLRICTSAGEALPKNVGERWQARYGVEILDGIGSTEMLHIFVSNRPGDVAYGSTGRPVPGYEVELRDEEGRAVDDDGVLWVKGPSAAAGYWNRRDKSLTTFHGPWTNTGDRFTRDAEGRYTYAGRADDMLKVSGIWVSPFEVESALFEHEAILEAAVVGRRDDNGLLKPHAYIVLKHPERAGPELERALKDFVKAKLAPYKYPRWIDFVDALPKTATGKIQRYRLRAP